MMEKFYKEIANGAHCRRESTKSLFLRKLKAQSWNRELQFIEVAVLRYPKEKQCIFNLSLVSCIANFLQHLVCSMLGRLFVFVLVPARGERKMRKD